MRILVTGGAGFIGSHVVDGYVADGHTVAVLDDLSGGFRENLNPLARFFEADIADAGALAECLAVFRPEVINHHAAQVDVRVSTQDPVADARTNVIGLLNLLQGAVAHGVRKVIYASSGGAIYGDARGLPVTEAAPIRPLSPYGVSKHVTEQYLQVWRSLHGLDYTCLRYANIYGPRQGRGGEAGVVAIFTGRLLKGEPCLIFGDGEQTRDYVYVGDVVEANRLALSAGGGEAVNIGTGVEVTVNDLYLDLCALLGVDRPPVYVDERPGEVRRSSLAADRAREVLGWQPRVKFRDGLAQVVAFMRNL